MPWLVASTVPLSTIAPVMVVPLRRAMPVRAAILPPLLRKPEIASCDSSMPKPCAALITPPEALTTSPEKFAFSAMRMPPPPNPRIVPLLVMPPEKSLTSATLMAPSAAADNHAFVDDAAGKADLLGNGDGGKLRADDPAGAVDDAARECPAGRDQDG